MRQHLLRSLLFALLVSVFTVNIYSQANNGTIGGVVQDSTKALIPGVTITLTNTQTGVVDTRLTNDSGAYSFPSVLPGSYKINANLMGFKPTSVENVQVGTSAQLRIDITLQIGQAAGDTISVTVDSLARIQESAASVGDVLSDQRLHDLPLVGNNVLDLLSVLPGFRVSAGGAAADTVGGLGLDTVNTTINGLSTNSSRDAAQFWGYQTFTTTVVNPDLVGEIRLILAPVDAELGRGNSQVQIQTRSGTNKYTGSLVWNVQNSGLNANTWTNNHTPTLINGIQTENSTKPDWYNIHEISASMGGPIIKNKTFFFFLYDHQLNKGRNLVSTAVYTDAARNGIFRYWSGWNPGNAAFVNPTTFTGSNTGTYQSVDSLGNPRRPEFNPDGTAYTGALYCFSLFGNLKFDGSAFGPADCQGGIAVNHAAWDTFRPNVDQSGYISKVLSMMPHANNFSILNVVNGITTDGLNTAAIRYVRPRNGANSTNASIGVVASPQDYNNRDQFNTKIDHNINKNNRISFQWTYEMVDSVGAQAAWPDGYAGNTRRRPQVFTLNGTSTITPNLVNEARFGLNYSAEAASPPWANPNHPDITAASQALLLQGSVNPTNGKVYPVIYNPGTNANGYLAFNAFDFANTSPLWDYADTLRWSHQKHAFSFGGEYRRPMTTGFNNSAYSGATAGNATSATTPLMSTLTNYAAELPGFLQTARNSAVAQTYVLNGSLATATTASWIDGYDDLKAKSWRDATTEVDAIKTADPIYGHQTRYQVANEWSFFAKDDYKILKHLTLNIGIRYDLNMSPYLDRGLTNRFDGDGVGLYGAGRPHGNLDTADTLLQNWMQPGNLFLTGYGSTPTVPLSCQVGVQQTPNLPVSTCDPALMSTVEFVGPGTPNPNEHLIPQHGKFSPALGFAWQVPYFGEGKTTMRGGFQRTYGGAGSNFSGGLLSGVGGDATSAGINVNDPRVAAILATGRALNLSDLATLIPAVPTRSPGALIPIAGRASSAAYAMYAPDYKTPYTDNFTLSITRNVSKALTIDLRFVDTIGKAQPGTAGSLSTAGSIDLNTVNVYHNPELFKALEATRAGLNDPLFDQMLVGLNLNVGTAGYAAVGTTPTGGVLQRGSMHIRRAFAANLANGNYASVMTALLGTVPAAVGGGAQALPTVIDPTTGFTVNPQQRLIRNGCDRIANGFTTGFNLPDGTVITPRCFPENYVITNPQMSSAVLASNYGHTNYQSGQIQFTARPTQGISIQGTYSLNKTMVQPGSGFTDPLHRELDYGQSLNSVGNEFRSNGTVELPIGPNKLVMGNSSGWVARLVEQWQTSFIFTLPQGALRTMNATNNMLYANGRPDVVGPWDNPSGSVTWNGGPSGNYFGDPSPYRAFADPQCSNTVGNTTSTDPGGFNLQGNCTLQGLGKVVSAGTPGSILNSTTGVWVLPLLQNPLPGHQGTLGSYTMRTVSRWNLDASISKRFRLTESKALQVRVDTTNIMNHPLPGDPAGLANTNSMIDTFGQVTTKTGSRTFQGQLRFTF